MLQQHLHIIFTKKRLSYQLSVGFVCILQRHLLYIIYKKRLSCEFGIGLNFMLPRHLLYYLQKKTGLPVQCGICVYVAATFTSIFPACMEQNIPQILHPLITQSSNYFHGKDSFFNYLAV